MPDLKGTLRTVCLFGFLLALIGCSDNQTYAPVVDAWHDPIAMKSRYRVQADDTLYSIALGFDVDYRDLAKANHLAPPYHLKPGQTLTMQVMHTQEEAVDHYAGESSLTTFAIKDLKPASKEGYQETKSVAQKPPDVVKKPEANHASKPVVATSENNLHLPELELSAIDCKFSNKKQPFSKKVDENIVDLGHKTGVINQDKIIAQVNSGRWQWPARGRILKNFSLHEGGNKGIDIAGNLGDPVRAVAPGKVVYSGSGLRGYGNLVIIKHSENYLSAYAHNKRLLVKEGDVVKAGAEIGKMGQDDAGRILLHFEIRRNGKPVNPLLYL